MNNTAFTGDKYSVYCKEHIRDFSSELGKSASQTLRGWFGRSGAILLALSTILNYSDAVAKGNPYSAFMLFTYAIPILVLLLYPAITIVFNE